MASNGRVAIVTGAGTGIGKASALALLGDGYSVTLSGQATGPAGRDGRRGRETTALAPL